MNKKTSPAGWLLTIVFLWLVTTVGILWRHDWSAPGTDSTTVTGAIGYSAAYAAAAVLVLALILACQMYGPRAWRGVRKLLPRYFQSSASRPDAASRGMGGPSTAPLGVQDTLSWRLGQGIHTTRLIGLAPLEQYQTHGFSSPISIWPSWKTHLLVWGGGPLAFFCSVAALLGVLGDNSLKARFMGGFGIVFFGFALIVFASALIRGRTKGLVEFSTRGMWISTLGITLPWRSIGPAWVNTTKKTAEVVFIVRGIDTYAKNLDPLAALYLRLLKRTLAVGKGSLIDFGLELLVLNAAEIKKLQEQIEYARTQAASDSSAILLNIPVPFRTGIAPQSLVAILNAEHAKHATALPTDAQPFVQADGFAQYRDA